MAATANKLRVRANLTHPNCLSGFIVVILPFMYVSFRKGRVLWNSWLIVSIISLIFALGITYSRNGYVAFFVSLIIVLTLTLVKHRIIKTILMSLLGVAFLLFIILQYLPFVLQRAVSIKYFQSDIAVLERFLPWYNGIKTFSNYPLVGIGVANFIYQPYSDDLPIAHNLFITTLTTMGILGFGGLVLFFQTIFKQLVNVYEYNSDIFLNKLKIGFWGSWGSFYLS